MVKLRKYEVILIAVCLIAVNLHRLFDGSGIRADVYLFYDYPGNGRNLSNILYEIGMHLSRLIPALILILRMDNFVFRLIFYYFVLELLGYILFFGQGMNLYIFPILLMLIIFKLWKKRKKHAGLYFWGSSRL